mmetsp:Transcript_12664/g.32121  ORF Transcript_12664/g.32121 Transcript_12664/m.32121 type:complete len:113 (+) Transcript_12664:67-405(+)
MASMAHEQATSTPLSPSSEGARPAWLQEQIAQSFAIASAASFHGYLILRSHDYMFADLRGTDLVKACMSARGQTDQLPRVLDVGAGEGAFLRGVRHHKPGRRRLCQDIREGS